RSTRPVRAYPHRPPRQPCAVARAADERRPRPAGDRNLPALATIRAMSQVPQTPARPLVLLADDEDAITAMLGPFLERAGFAVHVVRDGTAALAAVEQVQPDLCILDVLMPGLSGGEVLRRLRADGSWHPVVLLTQVGEAGERAMALEEGADDYLNKPFDPQELVARMRAVLRRGAGGAAAPG